MNRERVIKALQSILLSCKFGMAIHDLVKEFREMEGTSISFQAFGCDTLADFLRTSGCFVVKSTNDVLMVSAKQTVNSKHVNDLVNGQNVSKKIRRKRRSKLQHPRSPLETIYENDRAMRYGIQLIRKQIQPRRNRWVIRTGGAERKPFTQTKNSTGFQKNESNDRNDQGSVGHTNEVITKEPVQSVQNQKSQAMASINNTQNEHSPVTTMKPANFRLSKFSEALMRAMATEPADSMPLEQQSKPEPKPETPIKPFDFTELYACTSAVDAINLYCLKKMLPAPSYKFIQMKTKNFLCSVEVNDVRYGCYPQEYRTQDEAQMATAERAFMEVKALEECIKYPICKKSNNEIAQQINACIALKENGIFLVQIPSIFESTYQQSLPDNWRLIIYNNTDLFELATNYVLGKTIVYPKKHDTQRTGTIKKGKTFYLRQLLSNI